MADEYRTHNYEAMFLFPQSAGPRLAECVDHVVEIITKNGAELLGLKKWDERRLAYEIDKQKRGLYLLGYFRVDASAMKGIDRDLRLSELVMRSMSTRADHMTIDEMKATDAREDLAVEAKLRAEKAAEEEAAAGVDTSVSRGAPKARPAKVDAPAEGESGETPAEDAPEAEAQPAEAEAAKTYCSRSDRDLAYVVDAASALGRRGGWACVFGLSSGRRDAGSMTRNGPRNRAR